MRGTCLPVDGGLEYFVNDKSIKYLEILTPETVRPSAATLGHLFLPPLIVSVLCVGAAQAHYLLFHTVAELISIVIALTAMVVATTSRRFTGNHFTVYVALVIGWCGALDLIHTLTYRGMQLMASEDPDVPTQLWIAARAIQAVALLGASWFLRRPVRIWYLHAILGTITLAAALWVFSGTFPDMFVEGQGLTPLKIYAEYTIIVILLIGAFLLWQHRQLMSPRLHLSIQLALAAMVLSEFAFTRYVSLYGNANLVGHLLKVAAYWFVYVGLVQSTLREPFGMLTRTASTYEAVPDPVVLLADDGRIRQANQAAARYAGLPVEGLIGRDAHTLFHAGAVQPGECPVCARIARGDTRFTVEVERGADGGTVECTVAPFMQGGHGLVQVVRDITERKRLAAEREHLVWSLGERIKELRALYAITELIDQPDLDIAQLMNGVVLALPSGFTYPQQAQVSIECDWGRFGELPSGNPARRLSLPILVDGRQAGRIQVWYPDDLRIDGKFFQAEEHTLLNTVVQRIGESVERMQADQQVRRLTYLYDMLSATNRAIVRCRSEQALLEQVFQALVQHSAFPLLFIATTQSGSFPFRVVHAHGIDDDMLESLHAELEDVGSEIGKSVAELQQGQVVLQSLLWQAPQTAWLDYLARLQLNERALLPLVCEGRLVGMVALSARGPGTFDQAESKLLDEMVADLTFALNSLTVEARRAAAEARAETSEFRFREVFEGSPAPMQIMSLTTGDNRAINHAHEMFLGYALEDIRAQQHWLESVYADPAQRAAVLANWQRSIDVARTSGGVVQSPELRLRCKDGSERLATGTMTLIGDDAIIAWTDLTEIRRSEQALRESEQHFRTMIEQTVLGIYVRRNGRFVYVNPRYCQMTGWSREELLGQEGLRFTAQDPENLRRIHDAWDRLAAGEHSVHYNVSWLCKGGEFRELALHASNIVWDDGPAAIVVAEDVTERQQAQAKIASYVKQLEASMRGTLQAVSNMIDQRDPYTAGHERRVGLIAGAIAREMGWPEERCDMLELVGLVHDIGKIGVPAEILTKPGHLTDLEMRLVREHAQIGYEILKDVPFPFPVADIIRQHHERLDGSGYPQGLKSDAILPEAKVLAVADVIESIATHRPYRAARGMDVALDELERGRGSQYDPAVIDAFGRLLHDKGYTLPQ